MKKQQYKPSKKEIDKKELDKKETQKRNLIRKSKAGFFNPKIEL